MGVPWNVVLAACLPFPIVTIATIVLVLLYFIYFKAECSCFSAFVSVLLVVTSIMFLILLPVDVYLVSSTKNIHGKRQSWATNTTIIEMEKFVLYGYYGFYAVMLLLIFCVFPLAYFSNHKDSDTQTVVLNWTRGIKFCLAFLFLLFVVLVIGAVVPMRKMPEETSALNSQLKFVSNVTELQDEIENTLVFAINILGLIGMLCAIIYTAYGMVILPVNMIKGKPSEARQQEDFNSNIQELKENIQSIMAKTNNNQQPLSESDRQQLMHYSRHLSTLESESDTLRHRSYSCCAHVTCFTRPLEIAVGLIILILSWFLVATLIISNTNRLLSSDGVYTGYLLNKERVVNPLNTLLMKSHQVFPIDYLVLGIVIGYFTVSSISGMQHMGIWFLWFKIHNIRPGNTPSRALLFCSFVLALVTLYSGVLAYSLAPQYVTYGTQYYLSDEAGQVGITLSPAKVPIPCSILAPAEECVLTRLMALQIRLFYRMWFIGVTYYFVSWLFILVFLIAFAVAVIRNRKTIAQVIKIEQSEITEDQTRLL